MRRRDDRAMPRRRLVEQLARRDLGRPPIRDPRVLAAMEAVPRHLFVRENLRHQAYRDYALPLGEGQTISQPWVVARMTELLEVGPQHRVLEIGTGSGYQTAVLAHLAQWVFSLERLPTLAREAVTRIRDLELANVKVQVFDGTVGWSEVAPFHRILVTAAAPEVPRPLLDQLAGDGRLLIPEGDRHSQRLVLYRKGGDGAIRREELEEVAFVPLVGRHGWEEEK